MTFPPPVEEKMSLNIGGSVDAFFRYKMPDIQVKIEGRGNGIKTIIPNMADIGAALKRDPAYPTKYFSTELGALSQWDDKRNVGVVNGEHSKETLTKLLADFINRYVLCPQCKLPETDLKVKNGQIMAKCKACGFRGPSDNKHRVATYIISHPPKAKDDLMKKDDREKKEKDKGDKFKKTEKSEKGDKQPEKEKKKKSKDSGDTPDAERSRDSEEPADQPENGENGNGDEEDDGEIHFEITDEMRNMKVDENVELDDPVEDLEKLLNTIASLSADEQVEKIREHQKVNCFDEPLTFQYFFKAAVKGSMAKQVKGQLKMIKKLIKSDRDGQWLILSLIEERCEVFPENIKDVSATLMQLYDEDILEEETILTWHEKGVSQLIALADQRASRDARKGADKFVEWLKNAEEEDVDDDDDDE